MNRDRLMESLESHEGVQLHPYRDTQNLITIGIGRCLDRNGISLQEAYYLANNDIDKCLRAAQANCDFFETLSDVRQNVCIEMIFQLGIYGFLGFRKMLSAMRRGDWHGAAVEGLDSDWHNETPGRCEALMKMLETDTWP